jgi:hypothetical protein
MPQKAFIATVFAIKNLRFLSKRYIGEKDISFKYEKR